MNKEYSQFQYIKYVIVSNICKKEVFKEVGLTNDRGYVIFRINSVCLEIIKFKYSLIGRFRMCWGL